ncbi:MAG: chemotaxis protein CheD [Dehalococcoidia bacterium]
MSALAPPVRRVAVGIGQLAVSRDPEEALVAYGLGSCVGMAVYDPLAKVAGMVHVLLPSSDGRQPDEREPARFADTGVERLMALMQEAGALRGRLLVKIAGGAAVLGRANAEKFKIGDRNVEAILDQLRRFDLRLAAQDVGGTQGRTLELHVATGRSFVRLASAAAKEL